MKVVTLPAAMVGTLLAVAVGTILVTAVGTILVTAVGTLLLTSRNIPGGIDGTLLLTAAGTLMVVLAWMLLVASRAALELASRKILEVGTLPQSSAPVVIMGVHSRAPMNSAAGLHSTMGSAALARLRNVLMGRLRVRLKFDRMARWSTSLKG